MRLVFLFLACTVANPAALRAQDTLRVGPGSRVRARVASADGWQVGRLVAYGPDSLQLSRCRSCRPTAYSLDSVSALEVSVRRSTHTRTVAIAALGGAALGGVIGYANGKAAVRRPCDGPCGLALVYEPIIGGLAGLAVGTAVGVSIRYDTWRRVVVLSITR